MAARKLSENVLLAAIEGFESQKSRIDQRIGELRSMLNGGNIHAAAPSQIPAPRRKLSAAARRRIALAQRERWRKIRGEVGESKPATAKTSKSKRRISPEGLKRIIAATKRRWALKRAAEKKQAVAPKKTVSTKVVKKA